MSESQNEYMKTLGTIINSLLKDKVLIILFTLFVTIFATALGKLSNSATSTSTLLLTPLALQQQSENVQRDDQLAQMLSNPLDITTVALICNSDETLNETMKRINDGGKLEEEIEHLNDIQSVTSHRITVSKDTPYMTEYSPLLQLSVKWGNSQEAKFIVDTWAEVCVEHAENYRRLQQAPAVDAFQSQQQSMEKELADLESQLEAFYRENNLELVEETITQLILLNSEYLKLKYDTEAEFAANQSAVKTLKEALANEKATVVLNWQPSGKLTELLGIQAQDAADDSAPSALNQEVINVNYDYIKEKLTDAEAIVAESDAMLKEINAALSDCQNRIKDLQVEKAVLMRTETVLTREIELLEKAYSDVYSKNNYALLASNLEQPVLHVFSQGGEWRVPRFRNAILYGMSAGIFAFGIAASISFVLRLIIMPSMKLAKE